MPTPSVKTSAANRFEPATAAEEAEFNPKAKAAKNFTQADDDAGTEVQFVTGIVMMSTSASASFDVPEWEVEVLQEIHGAEAVKVTGSHTVNYPYNAAQAMQYLKNKYSTREQGDHIKAIYPRLAAFAKATGLPYRAGDETTGGRAQSLNLTKQDAAGSGVGGSAAA